MALAPSSAPRLACVLTTIQEPTPCVLALAQALARYRSHLIVIGDRKGPARFELAGAAFYSLADQERLPFLLARLLPTGHYGRKNLGYLLAMQQRADCIYETDDDNRPGPSWRPRNLETTARRAAGAAWYNVYRDFTSERIWPRGFPLEALHNVHEAAPAQVCPLAAPIQQGLADGAPDVDAVWRMVFGQEFRFECRPSVLVPAASWCPFNSQSTWWWPVAYPLLYLPSYCSFRMTDIWRSFVAQRCLWALGAGVVFHAPEVIQERNAHRIIRDFEEEIPGYLQNQRLVDCLAKLDLADGADAVGDNLRRCYAALIEAGIVGPEEMRLIEAWIADVEMMGACRRAA